MLSLSANWLVTKVRLYWCVPESILFVIMHKSLSYGDKNNFLKIDEN